VESFGYGVLEMLAGAIPVVAYDAPGPNVLLMPEFLVPVGDTSALAGRVIDLLADSAALRVARQWARSRAHEFAWERICAQTASTYTNRIALSRNLPI
jgi:glycosyltransferase involved in cell wall biosynthesis